MIREEFEFLQQKFRESGLGIIQFLCQERINYSTFSKLGRRYQAENLEVVKSEETLAPVSISHAK